MEIGSLKSMSAMHKYKSIQFYHQSLKDVTQTMSSRCFWHMGVFFVVLNTSFIPCGKFRWPCLGKTTAATRAALPIPTSVCCIFMCPENGNSCQCLGFLTCVQMLMYATTHEGFTNTIREYALGENPLPYPESKPSVLHIAFQSNCLPAVTSCPFSSKLCRKCSPSCS